MSIYVGPWPCFIRFSANQWVSMVAFTWGFTPFSFCWIDKKPKM